MSSTNKDEKFRVLDLGFVCVLVVKLLALVLFSSDYQNKLFMPFVSHFLSNFDNPWNYFYQNPQEGVEFPYSPVMLYIMSICYAPAHWLGIQSTIISNFFFKLPILLSDLLIFGFLYRIVFDKKKILIYYFATPIIIYASYMHSQIDLIPTAMLFASVYLLTKNKIIRSAIVFGLAMGTKFHVLAALPLILFYVYKKQGVADALKFLVTFPAAFFLLCFPFFGEGYYNLVLNNPQQTFVYDAFIEIGSRKIYLPLLAVFILYARYSAFRKINTDLLYTFLALVFCAFVALTVAAPGWYVWLFPFLSIFFIKYQEKTPDIIRLYVVLNIVYLVYIIFFYIPPHTDLIFLNTSLDLKIDVEKLRNVSFTFLEVALLASVYAFYKFGVKSNFYYIRNEPIVIGIAGSSGAGKTTTLSDIKKLIGGRVLHLEGDADHRWERGDSNWESLTHLNPKGNYLHRQYEDIVSLKYGKTVSRSDYDHSTGKFENSKKIKAGDYIALSGLHAFYLPKTRKIVDLKVFIDTQDDLRKHWKLARDEQERGHAKHKILKEMEKREEDAKKYIYPQKEFADMVVRYFTEDRLKIGDSHKSFTTKLQVTLDSSVPLNLIVDYLEGKVDCLWDYSQDLTTQTLILSGSIRRSWIEEMAKQTIVNFEELLGEHPVWLDGYRGFVQLMILLMLSEKSK